MPLAEGTRLGNCRLVRKLGEGGMAEVWEAVDVSLERRIAVKVVKETISSLPEFDARFRREAKTAAQLEHPNILPIYGFGVEDGVAYIEMPYLSGGTLGARLDAGPPPPPETACEWVEALASALDAAHERGIIHRDIKAVNVLFDQSGRIVLGDFGLAKNVADRSGLTATGTLMGTPMYLSPEQARGLALTPASDQFALGVLAYRMLTGQMPWGPNAAPAVIMMRIVSQAPPAPSTLRPELPAGVDAVFERVLAKKPEGRYESCGEFAAALRGALSPHPKPSSGDTPTIAASQPILVSSPYPAPAPPAVMPEPRPRPRPLAPAPAPPPAPRRTGLIVVLMLFLGVNSVVLGLVVWDKLGGRLPWTTPSPEEPTATPTAPPTPVPTPEPVAEPTPDATPGPTPDPGVVVEPSPGPGEEPTPLPTETPTPEPTPTPTVVPSPTPALALPAGAIPPVRSSDVRPVFDEDLMRRHAGLDGRVELEVLVNADGSVGSIRVVRGVAPEVDAVVSEAAARQLTYTPATRKDGRPIAALSRVVVGVRFRVESRP